MKASIAISLLILLVAAAVGINDRQRFSEARATHAKLATEAEALGISIATEGEGEDAQVTKRVREDKEAAAKAAAKEMIAFAKEMEKFKETGGQPDEEMQGRISDFMELMLSLDSNQLKILIGELRKTTELDEESRNGMVVWAIMTLSSDHPQAALALFTESPEIAENAMMGKHLLSSALANWASSDPDAALEWVRENGKKHPDLITDDIKAGLVKGAGLTDMKRGFDLIGELGLENPSNAIAGLAQGVKTPEERTRFLSLLREFSETEKSGDIKSVASSMGYLADGIIKDGFEAGSKWIAENKLTQEEIDTLSSTIGYTSKSSEKGQWITWMGENLGEDNRSDRIRSTMSNWTRDDYRAAGEWLAAAPEGDTKNAAVRGYAATVAKVDPTTATQWAMTLPEGQVRQETLREIRSAMPDKTPEEKAARDAFAEQYGIK